MNERIQQLEALSSAAWQGYGGMSDEAEEAFDQGLRAGEVGMALRFAQAYADDDLARDAYALYDRDERTNGPDDFLSFREAIVAAMMTRFRS